jgi:hypothetical protein
MRPNCDLQHHSVIAQVQVNEPRRVRVRRQIRIIGDRVALGTISTRVSQTFVCVWRAYVLGKTSLLIPIIPTGWSVLANNNCTPLATCDPTTDLSCACPDDLRVMRIHRVARIVLTDLVVPLTHSARSGPSLRYIFTCVIWKVFICPGRATVVNCAASALQRQRPSIGRTCQLRRPAQWLRAMTCAKLIVGSEDLVGKFLGIIFCGRPGRLRSGLRLWRRSRFRRR